MLFKIPGFAGLCHSSPINGYGFLPVTFEKAELQPKVLSSLTSSVPTQPTVHGSPGGFGLVPFFGVQPTPALKPWYVFEA